MHHKTRDVYSGLGALAARCQHINREARLVSENYCAFGQTFAVSVVNTKKPKCSLLKGERS